MTRQSLRDGDGTVVAAWCGEPLDEAGTEAMRALVEAARRYHATQDPDGTLGERQAAAVERIRARVRQIRGEGAR